MQHQTFLVTRIGSSCQFDILYIFLLLYLMFDVYIYYPQKKSVDFKSEAPAW